ncbi:HMG box-containing protein 1-like [Anneissia japonica]|uniref:HMG box-containing protein 1-like n=1 Tax=Anneissia japonica TaxID=1529436 RepID=UPI0014254D63|nr:HMG box-containing protein 1-like [Anneissia japonica]XP_033098786.1 HMG box-containing protein 1-like [Anneissia japonica]
MESYTDDSNVALDQSSGTNNNNSKSQLNQFYVCANCCQAFASTNDLRNHVAANCNTTYESSKLEVKESQNQVLMLTIDPQNNEKPSGDAPSNPSQTMVHSSIPSNQVPTDWLTQLANIATGPQSPLLQKSDIRSPAMNFNQLMHTYAKPPRSHDATSSSLENEEFQSRVLTPLNTIEPESDDRVSSSSPFPTCPEDFESGHGTWSHTWPSAVWQCFMKGSLIRFTTGHKTEWQLAEEIGRKELLAKQAYQSSDLDSDNQSATRIYAPNGLTLERIEEIEPAALSVDDSIPEEMILTFNTNGTEPETLQAHCPIDHPFFVKMKGWSSYNPLLTVEKYGIPCSELESGDICIPPSHPDAISFKESNVFESFKSFDLTPLDTSTVLALSSLARQRRDIESNQPKSAPPSPVKKSRKVDPNRGKRPMNAFMLFAKKFRLEYTQMYPGRDNRAISVVLGDEWKKLGSEERKLYAEEAKSLAEEHKKNHPDCWKRKRHASSSV